MDDQLLISPFPSTVPSRDPASHDALISPSQVKTSAHIVTNTGSQDGLSPPTPLSASSSSPSSSNAITLRQFILMAISGSIGAGLFIASGEALQRGGPGSLTVAFAIVGLAVWLTMSALGELASTIPARGSFYDYSVRFISESWGFAMGWNYVINFMLIVGFEITVIARLARYWTAGGESHTGATGGHGGDGGEGPSILSSGVIAVVPACLILLAVLQCFGPKWYGEAEHFFGMLKVGVLTVFVGTAVVIAAGGTKEAGGRGFENYLHNQAFRNSFPGFISVLAAAGLAYGGTEMLGLTAASTSIPASSRFLKSRSSKSTSPSSSSSSSSSSLLMPLGAKLVAARIILCYCLSLFMLGLVLRPSILDEPRIAALTASPFVIAVQSAGIRSLPSLINGVLIASVFSMANAAVFASSRALVAICERGMGPTFFKSKCGHGNGNGNGDADAEDGGDEDDDAQEESPRKRQKQKAAAAAAAAVVPWRALGAVFAVAMLAWLAAVRNGTEIFEWLLALASVSNLFTWASINICHIRFRRALRIQAASTTRTTTATTTTTSSSPSHTSSSAPTKSDPYSAIVWKSSTGLWGSYLAVAIIAWVMVAQIASAALPPVLRTVVSTTTTTTTNQPSMHGNSPGGGHDNGNSQPKNFVRGILGFIVVAILYLGHLAWLVTRRIRQTSNRRRKGKDKEATGTQEDEEQAAPGQGARKRNPWRKMLLVPLRELELPELGRT